MKFSVVKVFDRLSRNKNLHVRHFNTFYDSQSGSFIRSPQKSVRIHDSTLRHCVHFELDRIVDRLKSTKHMVASIEIPLNCLEQITTKTHKQTLESEMRTCRLYTTVQNSKELDQLTSTSTKYIKGIVFHINFDSKIDANDTLKLIQQTKNKQFITQVYYKSLLSSFGNGTILSEVSNLATLADYGVDQIIYVTNDDMDDYTLEQLLEECYNIDINGDPMSQRLGIQGNNEICHQALQTGITRIAVSDVTHHPEENIITFKEAESICSDHDKSIGFDI